MHLEQFSGRTVNLIFEAKERWPKNVFLHYVKNAQGECREPLRRLTFSEWAKYGFKTVGYNGLLYAFHFNAIVSDADLPFWRNLYMRVNNDRQTFHSHDKRVLV